jgi:hypothetical protein
MYSCRCGRRRPQPPQGGVNGFIGSSTRPPPVSGKCLDVKDGATADGTIVQLWTCNGSGAQNWSVQSDGTFRNGGKCLDALGGSSADGAQLIIWTCHGGSNQKWSLT